MLKAVCEMLQYYGCEMLYVYREMQNTKCQDTCLMEQHYKEH